jgi:hypothetical protein
MEKDNATLSRQGMSLFNFMSMKHQTGKKIGELTMKDFMEMCVFLTEMETNNE